MKYIAMVLCLLGLSACQTGAGARFSEGFARGYKQAQANQDLDCVERGYGPIKHISCN